MVYFLPMSRLPIVFLLLAIPLLGAELKISQNDFGESWPFKVKEGVLACSVVGSSQVITFKAGTRTYGVNLAAMASKKYADVFKLLRPEEPRVVTNPQTGKRINVSMSKKKLGPVISRGFELCP